MIEIIEHKDYNKPVDNYTVVKKSTPSGYKKFFKVIDGIWLDPSPTIETQSSQDPRIFTPYQKDYCQSVAQKSKYLEQMTILFKRINSIPLGQGLLEDLSKGAPIDFSNKNTWHEGNSFWLNEKSTLDPKKLMITCTISPNTEYLENQVIVNSKFGLSMINTNKSEVFFHPDCIYSIKKGKNVTYCDPVIPLTHELIHVLHSTYSVLGYTIPEEEYITFGSLDADSYLDRTTERYYKKVGVVLHNLDLIKRKISSIKNIDDKRYFEEKYGFTINNEINLNAAENYITRFQNTYSENSFAKQFNLTTQIRDSYDDKLFIPFKFDISDPKVYTISNGLLTKKNSLKEISEHPSNILVNSSSTKLHKILKKYIRNVFKRSSLDNNINNSNISNISLKSLISDTNLEHILNNISTVEYAVNNTPQKIMSIYNQKVKIDNIKEDMSFNAPPEPVTEAEYINKLSTFKVSEFVGFNRIKPQDMVDAHSIDSDLLFTNKHIPFTSEDLDIAIEQSNVAYISNKAISKKMALIEQGKAILKTGNTVVNITQFGMWVDELVEDFRGNTGKNNLHIAKDVLSILPYLGPMINIVDDLNKDGNYIYALKSLGILSLLEIFPELLLPTFLIDMIIEKIMNNDIQKKIIGKFIWGIVMEREQLLDEQLQTQSKGLANICIARINKIANHVETLLKFNVQAIMHNIKIYAYRQSKQSEDMSIIESIIFKANQSLLDIVEEKRTKTIHSLLKLFEQTISENFVIKAKREINDFNERTKLIITRLLTDQIPDISKNRIKEALNVVEKYIEKYNIDKIIKQELNGLDTFLAHEVELLLKESDQPLVNTHISLDKNNKPINNVNKKILNNYNIRYKWGRKGVSMCFKGGDNLQIKDPLFSYLNALRDFTIEFWIQIPLTEQYDKETNNSITIIKNGSGNNNGWRIILNNRYIIFSLCKKNGVEIPIGNYLITNNMWTKISIINSSSTQNLSFFINGDFINELPISRVSLEDINLEIEDVINIELPKHKNIYFALDDFKVYDKALRYMNISQSYEQDHDESILYDYFGNCIKKGREYILANYNTTLKKHFPINQLRESDYWVYTDSPNYSLQNYDFTIALDKQSNNTIIKKENTDPDIIYKNSNIIITSYDKSVIWGIPTDFETWGIEFTSTKTCKLHINGILRSFPYHKVYGLEADIATHYNSDCTFKIFNILNYGHFSKLLNNKNGISLSLYKDKILKALLIHHNKEILLLNNVLKNKSIVDENIIIEPPYLSLLHDLEDYLYKSIFYLFPVDELEYYIRLYE